MNQITLGSLFDGSGGFTLGAIESGIIPVWASITAIYAKSGETK